MLNKITRIEDEWTRRRMVHAESAKKDAKGSKSLRSLRFPLRSLRETLNDSYLYNSLKLK